MRRATLAFLIGFLLTLPLAAADAQRGWLITAGRGVGPIYIGMTEQDAIRALGEPQKRITRPFHGLSYPGVELIFYKSREETFTLLWIRITDRTATTQEGIRLGSSLSEVLRRYGDGFDNSTTGQTRCLMVDLISPKAGALGSSSYRTIVLTLHYEERGIQFAFTNVTEGVSFTPRVDDIIITHPSSCSG